MIFQERERLVVGDMADDGQRIISVIPLGFFS